MREAALMARLDACWQARLALFEPRHEAAFRLCNGFLEGLPSLVIDLYGKTAVLHNYANPPTDGELVVKTAVSWLQTRLPWLQAILLKTRRGQTDDAKRGVLLWGTAVDRHIREHTIRYALDLTMNQDASFYLDTRCLRHWIHDNLAGQTVLNTFAYTGSLGVAAMAAGATRVIHTDRNRHFLNLAKTSYTLNGFPIDKRDFITGDFWPQMNQLKRAGTQFDAVFLDPPFFSTTAKGTVDLSRNTTRLINKVRPLVRDGGCIVAINNALFYSGADYLAALESLCADGYVTLERLIPVPPDFTGYPNTVQGTPITDPAPFNHSTKIALLRIRHKGAR